MHKLPKLPVLGWPAFTGERNASCPGVLDARYHRYTVSGRAAISLALQILGGRSGNKVLVPTYHCTTMIVPVVHAEMIPLFYPTTPRGAPDLDWLRKADLTGVRAMLAAHYFGFPQAMAEIRAFCDERGISLIEDCAHAFFGVSDDRSVGAWGDVAIASLTKFFPVSEGGLLVSTTTPLDPLFLTPRSLRDELKAAADAIEVGASYGRFTGLNGLFNLVFELKRWLRGQRSVSDDAAPAPALPALPRLPQRLLASIRPARVVLWIVESAHRARIVALRRRNFMELARLFSGMTAARPLFRELPGTAAPYVFPLYVDDPESSYQRLRAAGVPIFRWDDVWPGTPAIENDNGLDWATHVFQLGCHQDLSLEDIRAFSSTVKEIIEGPSGPRGTRTIVAPATQETNRQAPSYVRTDGMKRLLMIAYHFPPLAGSSGIQRTLSFARHLPRFGWEPLILTAHPRAYARVSDDLLADVAPGTVVERAFALDSARHLSLFGRYPGFIARPDRWATWWLGAVPRGLAMIRRYRPEAIWSTYPVATAHAIGQTLHRLSGLPWIADFRDPMAQDGYPADPRTWQSFQRIEEAALRAAVWSVFVTPGAARLYIERYPDLPRERLVVIENGYDEETFQPLDAAGADRSPLIPGTVTLLHSGVVYTSERDPTHFFHALRGMLETGKLRPGELRVRLRASAYESALKPMIAACRLEDVVELSPPIPYRDALQEMLRADGLLVLQASNCNAQVPAKVYEYFRCRRPIVGLTDPVGDTAAVLRDAGVEDIARLDSVEEIATVLRRFLDKVQRGSVAVPDASVVAGASRLYRSRELAALLDRLPDSRLRRT
jgi:dTDP-4-amino-4,6-dideoxygalactose transaminase/glycosyltransferase involved in cell wall biosynthesis